MTNEGLQAIASADDVARQLGEDDEQIVKCAVIMLSRVAVRKTTTPESLDEFVDKFIGGFIDELEPMLAKKLSKQGTEGVGC